jgi:Protein of unknown function (DUF1524)
MIGSTQLQEALIAGHYGRSIPTGWTGRSSVIPSERSQPSRRPRARRHGLADVANEDYEATNLEHIIPMKPGPNWQLSADEAVSVQNLIGNLTLLSKLKRTQH